MLELMGVLEAELPQHLDDESLRPLLAKYNRQECLRDGWRRRLLIERDQDPRHPYTIISLGRYGRRGGCCRRWVYNWDDNAVLSGMEWRQVWQPNGAPDSKKDDR